MIIGSLGTVQTVGLDGKVLNTIAEFGGIPKYIMLHPNRNELFVQGDWSTDDYVLKISMTENEMTKKVSQIPFSSSFGSLAVDKTGAMFTCSKDGTSVIQLFAELQIMHITNENPLTTQRQSLLCWTPQCLFYCNKEDKLYIGTEKGFITVYKMQ